MFVFEAIAPELYLLLAVVCLGAPVAQLAGWPGVQLIRSGVREGRPGRPLARH